MTKIASRVCAIAFTVSLVQTALADDQPTSFLEVKREQQQAETAPPPKKKKSKKHGKNQAKQEIAKEDPGSRVSPPARAAIRESQDLPPVPASPQEEETRLTKNWGGARRRLSDRGIDMALIYKNDVISNLSGGVDTGTAYLANIDFRLSIDGDKLVGWKGGSIFVYLLGDYGRHPNANFVGSAQGVDNIETSGPLFKVYELWAQQLFEDDKISLLAGLHDLNSEFYVTETSGLFLNPNFGVGTELSQTGQNGPSIFPNTSLAVRLRAEPSKSFYIQWAVFDAIAGSGNPGNPQGSYFRLNASDGLLLINEVAYRRGAGDSKQLPAKYAFGVWSYTSKFNSINRTVLNPSDPAQSIPATGTNYGSYILIDQAIRDNFAVFGRLGFASTDTNRFGSAFGTGFVVTGLIPGRDKDRLGFSVAHAANGDAYKETQNSQGNQVNDAETTLELTYRIEALRGVALQPDFQYVIHPNTNPLLSNAKVLGTRLELSF